MAKELLRRVWWFDFWQIGKIETWLADMAAQGWHLYKTGLAFALFTKGEPAQVKYRCDVFKRRSAEFQDRIDLYQHSGWEYILSFSNVHIFKAPAQQPVLEIHTDPQEQAPSMALLLRPYQWITVVLILVIASYLVIPIIIIENFLLLHLDTVLIIGTALLMLPLFFLGRGIMKIVRIIARLRQGIPMEHSVPYRGDMLAKPGILLVGAIILGFYLVNIFNLVITPIADRFGPIPPGELPVVRISQVYPNQTLVPIENPSVPRINHYTTNTSLLIPGQWHLLEHVNIRGRKWPNGHEYSPMLRASGYLARSERLAQVLGQRLAQSSLDSGRGSLTKVSSTYFSLMWELRDGTWYEFVAVQGKQVVHIAYNGLEPSEDIIRLVKDKMDGVAPAGGQLVMICRCE